MELKTLNYFLAVAREENMTRAAEQLHVTQPTLSKQLKALEEELERNFLRDTVSAFSSPKKGFCCGNVRKILSKWQIKSQKNFILWTIFWAAIFIWVLQNPIRSGILPL